MLHYVRLSMIVLKKKKQTVLEWLLVILGQHASCDSDHGLQAWEAETFIRHVKTSRQSRAFGC